MVGVPGRSKGCNTCRKRKIACSLEKPHCFQCVSSGRECYGYQKDRVFVPSSSSSSSTSATNVQWRPESYRRIPAANRKGEDHELIRYFPPNSIQQHLGLQRGPYRRQLVINVLAPSQESCVSISGFRPWMSRIPDLASTGEPLEMAAIAFSLAITARREPKHREELFQNSRNAYGQALRYLANDLADPNVLRDDRVFAACLVMTLYEVHECPSGTLDGYLSHYSGCARLVELRGPEAYKTGIAHYLFLAFRTMGAFESLLRGECFLTQLAWQTIPFSVYPKATFEIIKDAIFDLPTLVSQGRAIMEASPSKAKHQKALELAHSLWQTDRNLQRFYDETRASVNGPLYWPVLIKPETSSTDDAQPLFSCNFHFIDIHLGYMLMLYWATLCCIWRAMSQLYLSFDYLPSLDDADAEALSTIRRDLFPETDGNLPPLDHRTNLTPVAHSVFQSIEFCAQDYVGLPLIITPVHMVLDTLMRCSGFEREIEFGWMALERFKNAGLGIVKCVSQRARQSQAAERARDA